MKARDHFLISAKNGRIDAQYNLGILYLDKLKDAVMAYNYLKMASRRLDDMKKYDQDPIERVSRKEYQ